MKKYCRIFALAMLAMVMVSFWGCGDKNELEYKNYSGTTAELEAKLVEGRAALFSENSISLTYSYMSSTTVGGTDYNIGTRNIIKINRGEGQDTAINRMNYYYGAEADSSESYYYSNGNIYTSQYGALYTAPITEDGFMSFTDSTKYAIDRDFFDVNDFEEIRISERSEENRVYYRLRADKGETMKKIVTYLGFDATEYTYSIKDIEYTATFTSAGLLLGEKMTFTAEYSDVQNPADAIVYEGEFTFTPNQIGNVSLYFPYTAEAVEVEDMALIDRFSEKAFDVLESFTTLDAEYDRYVYAEQDGAKYTLENHVHFTEAYRDGEYTYGSMDKQYYSTPYNTQSSENGMFIDGDGYHYRSTVADADADSAELPYSELQMIYMVGDTLSAERPIDEDICDLKVTESDTEIVYTFAYTEDAVRYYGEYLLSTFANAESDISLTGATIAVTQNNCTVKVRKSDGCVISQVLRYNVKFNDEVTVVSKFDMKVNATGDSVEVFTLADWDK